MSFFFNLESMVNYRGDYLMIWHHVIWYIWKVINDVIFNGVAKTQKEVEEKIIFWLEIGFWVSRERTLAPSHVSFRALFFLFTYSWSSIWPDLECNGGSSFLSSVEFNLLMVDPVGLRFSPRVITWFCINYNFDYGCFP